MKIKCPGCKELSDITYSIDSDKGEIKISCPLCQKTFTKSIEHTPAPKKEKPVAVAPPEPIERRSGPHIEVGATSGQQAVPGAPADFRNSGPIRFDPTWL